MIRPVGLISGHYECRSFEETIPILTDILALEVVERKEGGLTLKHPNTEWRVVAHESGPTSPDKPLRNHYGVRVATNQEVDRANEYLESKKKEYRIKIIRPKEYHNAYSVHFFEPGGNFWEIESYENAVKAGIGKTTDPHWKSLLPEEKFPGKGYVPQALSHGTIECEDLEASRRFYEEALGLEIVNVAGRRWGWQEAQLLELADALTAVGFELADPELDRVARWTARGLTAYDAAYVAVAEAAGLALVTDDGAILQVVSEIATALGSDE